MTAILDYAVWGVKSRYEVFFGSANLDLGSETVKKGLADIRSIIRYASVDLNFYAYERLPDGQVFSSFAAVYDWVGRKNGFVAVSLFVPAGKRIKGGAAPVLDELLALYQRTYVDENYKVRTVKEDPAPFLALVEEVELVEEPIVIGAGGSTRTGVVRYAPGEIAAYLAYPHLPELGPFGKVFFLPAEQRRLSHAPTLDIIRGKGGGSLRPQPRPAVVVPKPPSHPPPPLKKAPVRPALIKQPVTPSAPPPVVPPSAPIAPPEIAPVTEPPTPTRKAVPQKGKDTLENPTVWARTGKPLDGPYTVRFLFRDRQTGQPVKPRDGHLMMSVNNLGGTFYGADGTLEIKGLQRGTRLMGNVKVAGYRYTIFDFQVPEITATDGSLEEVIVLDALPVVETATPVATRSAIAESPASLPGSRQSVKEQATKRKWLKQLIGVGLLAGIAFMGWTILAGDKTDKVVERSSDPVIIGSEEGPVRSDREVASVERHRKTNNLVAFANAEELRTDETYLRYLRQFIDMDDLAFTTPEEREEVKERIEAMRAAANADYRVREAAPAERERSLVRLRELADDSRLTAGQQLLIRRRVLIGERLVEDAREAVKKANEAKEVEKRRAAMKAQREQIQVENAQARSLERFSRHTELHPQAIYNTYLEKFGEATFRTSKKGREVKGRIVAMQQVSAAATRIQRGEPAGKQALQRLANNIFLTKEQRQLIKIMLNE